MAKEEEEDHDARNHKHAREELLLGLLLRYVGGGVCCFDKKSVGPFLF